VAVGNSIGRGPVADNGIVDTTTAHGSFVFGIFALMAEYEAALIKERTQAGPRESTCAVGRSELSRRSNNERPIGARHKDGAPVTATQLLRTRHATKR